MIFSIILIIIRPIQAGIMLNREIMLIQVAQVEGGRGEVRWGREEARSSYDCGEIGSNIHSIVEGFNKNGNRKGFAVM
jgi:hypothetical protein